MAPLARVSHALPGRIRIRIDEKRGDEAYFADLKQALAEVPDIIDAETNSRTGSVLVRLFGDGLSVWRYAEESGLFHVAEKGSRLLEGAPLVAANAASNGRQAPAKKLRSSVRHPANWRPVILLGLLGLGIAEAIEGNITVPALSAFWYAYHLYLLPDAASGNMESNPPDGKSAKSADTVPEGSSAHPKLASLA